MALTLSESAKLSQDMLQRGVIETIIEESPIMDWLPFENIEGNSLLYNQENDLGTAGFVAPGDVITESTATFTQASASLAEIIGDADVDNFIQRTRSGANDQRAVQTALKAKAVARKFEQTFISGDGTSNSFSGLKYLLTPSTGSPATSGQVLEVGTSGGALTLALLDQTIDLVKSGKPDILLMSKRTRRKLKGLLQASSHYVEQGADQFGRQVMFYDGIPVLASDFIADTDTGSVGGTNLSSLYAIQFGAEDALCGLQNGGIETIDIGQLETKDATRVRIRWYVSLALFRASAVARLSSINNS